MARVLLRILVAAALLSSLFEVRVGAPSSSVDREAKCWAAASAAIAVHGVRDGTGGNERQVLAAAPLARLGLERLRPTAAAARSVVEQPGVAPESHPARARAPPFRVS